MIKEKYDNRIIEIAQTYGYETQSRQCIEEMAELTQAINKLWRISIKKGVKEFKDLRIEKEYKNLIEEIADVQIMIDQMKLLSNCGHIVPSIIDSKLNREIQRIKKVT